MKIIEYGTNPFGGVVPKPDSLPSDPEEFKADLSCSLEAWRRDGFQIAWLEVPISKCHLIPVAVQAGFRYHHAGESYLMMILNIDEKAEVPGFASHYIGAGGVVIRDTDKILVVRENRGKSGPSPYYKLPGGAIHPGEHIADGVMREVFEETGVKTQFESLICFRNWHGYRYGKSDIYFICRLIPLSYDIRVQQAEIVECQWMPVQQYIDSENVSNFNKQVLKATLNNRGLTRCSIKGYEDPVKYEFYMP